jgi:glycosyltransferase involved in cell wall biosynthesis
MALFIGTFATVKGVDVLLDAWADVVRRVPNARLRLVGDGPLRASFERRCAARDMASVEFAGSVPPERLTTLIDECTLVVVPSRSEGRPRVLLEAFARRRPVVASNVGGIPDVVTHDVDGLLVAPDDATALAHAMVRLLNDRDLAARLGANARGYALAHDPAVEFEAGVAALAAWAAP